MLTDDSIQSMGGNARREALTEDRRVEIAKKAAVARWSLPKAICGAPDQPLRIGGAEIPCYVLEDETRVLVQSGMIRALGMSHGGSGSRGGDRLAKFTHQQRLKPFMDNEILERTSNPVKFQLANGSIAYGYDATLLAKICFAVVDAAKQPGLLQKQQEHVVKQADLLIRGFAIVGITALVDEATGYQKLRAGRALAEILEKFIAKELQGWTRTFPVEFYEHIFRLKNWPFEPGNVRRPAVIGHYTNDIVYKRLAPGVLDELRRKNPVVDGRRKHKFFQWLTGDIGHPKLRSHLDGVLAIMRVSESWEDFRKFLNKAFPVLEKTVLGFEVAVRSK